MGKLPAPIAVRPRLGGIYASVALALVMIYQATHLVNFAQGEMAMFSTYIAWKLIDPAIRIGSRSSPPLLVLVHCRCPIERIIIRPVERGPVLTSVIVFIGLSLIFNRWPDGCSAIRFKRSTAHSRQAAWFGANICRPTKSGMIVVTLAVLALVLPFLPLHPARSRDAGRGAESGVQSSGRHSRRLDVGVRLGPRGAIGSVAGMMAAPIVYLDPNMMGGVLLYGFAGAVLGGIDNPWGGGRRLRGRRAGNLIGAYVVGSEVKLSVALAIIIAVLVWRPSGLFGRRLVARV